MKILVLGYLADDKPLKYLADEFERLGHKVIRVACDIDERGLQCDYNILKELSKRFGQNYALKVQMKWEKIDLSEILEQFDYDCIFRWDIDLELNFEHIEKPVFYLNTNVLKAQLFRDEKPAIIFYGYFGADGIFVDNYTYQCQNCQFIFIHNSWSPKQYPLAGKLSKEGRDIRIGFMGATSLGGEQAINPFRQHIYDDRLRYLNYLSKSGLLTIREFDLDIEYKQFMSRVNLALNIGADWGHINQRQYHAMGMGCILLQKYYSGIEKLGFVNKRNCLLFNDEMELISIINWANDNPEAIEFIRKEGYKLALSQTLEIQAKEILKSMEEIIICKS